MRLIDEVSVVICDIYFDVAMISKCFILRLSCFAAAKKHYLEPISRPPHGAAAGKI